MTFSPEETDRIIEMAWEDRTPFEAIRLQFGLDEAGVTRLMRNQLKRSSFERPVTALKNSEASWPNSGLQVR